MKKINFNVLLFLVWDLLLILIITLPAFISLLKPGYFSMHDDQHIVRLFLLEQGVKQGYFFPRWVDGLGFGYGYPLFNFFRFNLLCSVIFSPYWYFFNLVNKTALYWRIYSCRLGNVYFGKETY
jgi:hypothetical protein